MLCKMFQNNNLKELFQMEGIKKNNNRSRKLIKIIKKDLLK